ncbi:hypothetical protein MNBD_DELTA01-1845 [hydrothermal vent metagenome]|uniref:FRG domain-containing protein n=1 Tax=hydrothermal vent metagenome TaxID=652676 RepID=A0A3B0QYU5_9ZZZZ
MKIKDIEVENWNEFEKKLKELYIRHPEKPEGGGYHSRFVFRGQADSGWDLETTLDRDVTVNMPQLDYYRTITYVKPQIETFTGERWNIPSTREHPASSEKVKMDALEEPIALEYMIYLRHHGFPSPLLDWTRSYYIAAFFAFDGFVEKKDSKDVAIYVYREWAGKGKSSSSDAPWVMKSICHNVKTHRRHFIQQCEYTLCHEIKNKEAVYGSHEYVFSDEKEYQNLIWKFIIPKKEFIPVQKKLDEMNINAYSLFGSEESLMKTIALREFKLKE